MFEFVFPSHNSFILYRESLRAGGPNTFAAPNSFAHSARMDILAASIASSSSTYSTHIVYEYNVVYKISRTRYSVISNVCGQPLVATLIYFVVVIFIALTFSFYYQLLHSHSVRNWILCLYVCDMSRGSICFPVKCLRAANFSVPRIVVFRFIEFDKKVRAILKINCLH